MALTPSLYVIDGDYGLASLDVCCTQSILYARVKKIPIVVIIQNSIKSCALYTVPTLKCENVRIEKFPNVLLHWKSKYGNLDEGLTAKEASETLAIMNLITTKLHPVLEFLLWVDQRNCEDFTMKWYMKAFPFPFNYSYTKRRKHEASQLIETLYPLDTDMEVLKEFVTKMATQCLSTLSTRLGKGNYFYGDSPLTLDIVVYSYIASLLKLPLPSNSIPSLISMWPNLCEFVKRIDAKYFSELKRESKYLKSENKPRQNDDEVSYAAVFILAVSAVSLVVGFALKRGFVQVPSLH